MPADAGVLIVILAVPLEPPSFTTRVPAEEPVVTTIPLTRVGPAKNVALAVLKLLLRQFASWLMLLIKRFLDRLQLRST